MPSKNNRNNARARPAEEKEPEPPKLIMLKHETKTIFPEWKEAMRNEIVIEFGDLVSLIDNGKLLDPSEVEVGDYDPEDCPRSTWIYFARVKEPNLQAIAPSIFRSKNCYSRSVTP